MVISWIDALLNSGWAMICAGTAIVFTQLIISRRERTKLLTGKLEDLSAQLGVARANCNRLASYFKEEKGHEIESVFETSGVAANAKLALLVRLHFPRLEEEAVATIRCVGRLFSASKSPGMPNEDFAKTYSEALDSIEALDDRIYDEAEILVKQFMPCLRDSLCRRFCRKSPSAHRGPSSKA